MSHWPRIEQNDLDMLEQFIIDTSQPQPRNLLERAEHTLSVLADSGTLVAIQAVHDPSQLPSRIDLCTRAIRNILSQPTNAYPIVRSRLARR